MRRQIYRLSIADPHAHLLQVEVRVGSVSGPVELVMPSWTPGSYLMREFARHVQEFEAADGAGAPLAWEKTDKSTWRVESAGGDEVRVRYRVYANELSVRTSHVDATHAYVNGASVFMFVRGREEEPAELEVVAPADWRVATSLPVAGAASGGVSRDAGAPESEAPVRVTRLLAGSYDELVDSPLEIGTHKTLSWEQDGIPHEYAIWGRAAYDGEQILADTRAIIDTAKAMFGGALPYERFVFILHVVPDGRGGLEHRSSCSLQVPPKMMSGGEYEHLVSLIAHEFFHVWNAKRIRPETLGPFDYTRENYTRNLWVVEGITTYVTDLILVRAGVITPARFLERLGDAISRLQSLPGRHHQSLHGSSFDTWIRFYRPDEHTPNAQISYYHKGALVSLLLDMEIRRATGGERSLDDLLALLWERYGARDVGFPEDSRRGIEAMAEEVAGVPLGHFFDTYLRGTDELDYRRALEVVGLTLVEGEPEHPARTHGAEEGSARPTPPAPPLTAQERRLGFRTVARGDRLVVRNVLVGTPAHRGGLEARDELIAVDGARATQEALNERLDAAPDGVRLTLTIMRRDELTELTLTTGCAVARFRVEALDHATEAARRERQEWLGAQVPVGAR